MAVFRTYTATTAKQMAEGPPAANQNLTGQGSTEKGMQELTIWFAHRASAVTAMKRLVRMAVLGYR